MALIARFLDWLIDRFAPIPPLPADLLADLEADFEAWEPASSDGREAGGSPPVPAGLRPSDVARIDQLVADYRDFLYECFTK